MAIQVSPRLSVEFSRFCPLRCWLKSIDGRFRVVAILSDVYSACMRFGGVVFFFDLLFSCIASSMDALCHTMRRSLLVGLVVLNRS